MDIGASESWHVDGIWQYTYEANFGLGSDEATMAIYDFNPQGIAYDSDSSNDTFEVSGWYSYGHFSNSANDTYVLEDNGPFTVTPRNAPWTWTVEEDTNCYIIETSARRGPSYSTHEVRVYKDKVVFITGFGEAEMKKID